MSLQLNNQISIIHQELWHRGHISFLLYPHQKPIYDKIRQVMGSDQQDANSYVIDCSRQYGKSFTMFLIAVEECIRQPNITIAYVAPLKSQVVEIVTENTFRTIFANAPKELIPTLNGSALQFNNGSRIRLAGTDNKNYANLRGGSAHYIFLDEAGFMSDLDNGVLPSVTPMLKTTGGKIIFASTPPESLDHPYQDILKEHDESGLISTFTIWDDKALKPHELNKIIKACKGRDTTLFKREYECKRISESNMQVIPELTEQLFNSLKLPIDYLSTDPLYQFWHKYVVIDTGIRDKTAVIFAHYNFKTRNIIIEHYLDLQGSQYSTAKLAEMIKNTVTQLWSSTINTNDIRYIADSNNQIVIADLNIIYKIPFVGTSKGRLDEMVQKVRDWVFDQRIWYLPNEGEQVMQCAKFAVWSKNRTEFARSNKYGHYDALAALTYLVRNVNETSDPVPQDLNYNYYTQHKSNDKNFNINKQQAALNSIFKSPRR